MKEKIKLTNFIYLFIAGVINAFGVTIFLYPVHLYDSGVSGLSMLLDQVTPSYLTLPIFLIVINVPLFIYGLKKQGTVFTIYSIFSVAMYSLFAFLFQSVIPFDYSLGSPITHNDLLLCSLFGGLISGIGSGLVIKFGGAIDGIDVLSVLFAKKLGLSIGTFELLFDLTLYIVCGFVFSSWILPLYSAVAYFVGSKTVDFIVDGIDRCKCAMIITTRPNEIDREISAEFNSSGTLVECVGGYTKAKKTIIYYIVNHFQINKLKNIIYRIDPQAFISISDTSEVIKSRIE